MKLTKSKAKRRKMQRKMYYSVRSMIILRNGRVRMHMNGYARFQAFSPLKLIQNIDKNTLLKAIKRFLTNKEKKK
jgi:hypothetical protein